MLDRKYITVIILFCLFAVITSHAGDDYRVAREKLISVIEEEVRDTDIYIDKSALDPRVMETMAKVPRHEFVPAKYKDHAYENRPLPIGHGQTISQPYIVALMTDLLNVRPGDKVLEVGTGSGYQAAILAELVRHVYTIEIIEALGKRAKGVFEQQSLANVQTRIGDGYYGWKEHAPYDAIVVTAAAGHIPPPLIKQLKPGGRMIIPVGSRFMVQQLVIVEKDKKGKVSTRQILPVRFVPLTGKHDKE